MIRKIFFLSIILLTLTKVVFSQGIGGDSSFTRPLNSINIASGDASLISLTYERLFNIKSNFFLAGKLGVGYSEQFQLCLFGPCSKAAKNYLTIPLNVTANFGKKKNFFEIGIGGTMLNGNTNQHFWMYPIVGFRGQPLKSERFNFRIFSCLPLSGFDSEDILFLPFGLSTGFVF